MTKTVNLAETCCLGFWKIWPIFPLPCLLAASPMRIVHTCQVDNGHRSRNDNDV